MPYQIDFIGVKEQSVDADAIALRWYDSTTNCFKIGVYDGGTIAYADKLETILDQYYFNGSENDKVIDFVVCSHADQDHASGLRKILEDYTVNALYMNIPWLHIDYLFDQRSDQRITKDSLERRLKDKYKYIADLEEIAHQKGISIYPAFQGTCIENAIFILSPSRDFYLNLLVESDKTPLEERGVERGLLAGMAGIVTEAIAQVSEFWDFETLRERVSTNPENEMSVVLLGNMIEGSFLLTGDAGIRALKQGIDYWDSLNTPIKDCVKLMQIPHHGSRHNVSPSILDKMLGGKVREGEKRAISAVASVGKGSDHPRKMVVNAYLRRGAKVYLTGGSSFCYSKKMPSHPGWSSAEMLTFSQTVEGWND